MFDTRSVHNGYSDRILQELFYYAVHLRNSMQSCASSVKYLKCLHVKHKQKEEWGHTETLGRLQRAGLLWQPRVDVWQSHKRLPHRQHRRHLQDETRLRMASHTLCTLLSCQWFQPMWKNGKKKPQKPLHPQMWHLNITGDPVWSHTSFFFCHFGCVWVLTAATRWTLTCA